MERVYAVLDHLSAHRATDVLHFALAHPRWELVFQPNYAASRNLIEPWWKILRSDAPLLARSMSRHGGPGVRPAQEVTVIVPVMKGWIMQW